MHSPLALADLRAQTTDDMRVAGGRLDVHLDDGRTLHSHHDDLLAVVADLADHRAVLDRERTLLLDPLAPRAPGQLLVLQIRLESSGIEVGVCSSAADDFDDALARAWDDLRSYAQATSDAAMLDELLLPHPEHYSARLLALQPAVRV